jgi:hypothetical protein
VLPRERQQVVDDSRRSLRLARDHVHRVPLVRRDGTVGEQQLRERRDTRQRVVQLVRDAAHELPDRGHLLGLDQLLL